MADVSHTATCHLSAYPHEDLVRVGDSNVPSRSAFSPVRVASRASWGWTFLTLPEVRWAALATVLFLVAALAGPAGAPRALVTLIFAGCYVAGGWEPARAGLHALLRKTLDVDLLMIVAALVAASVGQILDGGLLIVIFATSGALEAVATKRTRDSVRTLLTLAPERATLLLPDDSERLVDTGDLVVGQVIVVRPGERVGADGEVVAGASEIDQATITGEPLPVVKAVGDEVFAGTLNGQGALRVRVTRAAADSVVARIVALVEEASATKAQTQLFIEKVEQRYSVGMVGMTLALFFIPLALGGALQPTLLRAITFMIVASPCAVVLATMPPLLSAIANAGRHGVLVKSAVVMERLGSTTQIAFDKTGTLTEGTPQVADVHAVLAGGVGESELLRLAASAERPSEHPLARAVVTAAADRGLLLAEATDFRSTPGRGVVAIVEGRRIEVGSPVLLEERAGHRTVQARLAVTGLESAGRTAVVVIVDGDPVGVLGLADRLRPMARATVATLTALTGREPILLTGDNALAAARLGVEAGISDVRAGLLPQDKVVEVGRLRVAGQRVLVVGDGVNDGPALAAADLGVAMGRQGSDLALQTADAVIVRDELNTLPTVIDLSRRARRVVIQNLILASTIITLLVGWDLLGHLPLPLGVAGHEGSTVIVGLNGLRLVRRSAWRVTGAAAMVARGSDGRAQHRAA